MWIGAGQYAIATDEGRRGRDAGSIPAPGRAPPYAPNAAFAKSPSATHTSTAANPACTCRAARWRDAPRPAAMPSAAVSTLMESAILEGIFVVEAVIMLILEKR